MDCQKICDFFVVLGVDPKLKAIGEVLGEVNTDGVSEAEAALLHNCYLGTVTDIMPPPVVENKCELPDNLWMFCCPQGFHFTRSPQTPTAHPFVLTEVTGRHMFGSCIVFSEPYESDEVEAELYVQKSICMLGHYPFLEFFKDYLAELMQMHKRRAVAFSVTPPLPLAECDTVPLERCVANLMMEVPFPPPGKVEVEVSVGQAQLYLSRPPANSLPMCDPDLPVIFECFPTEDVVSLFNNLLLEKQIVFVSSQCSLLTCVAEGLMSLIYPFRWDHVYIPILPRVLAQYTLAPMPFVMGLERSTFMIPDVEIPEEVIIADIDAGVIRWSCESTTPLPEYVHKKLLKRLSGVVDRKRGSALPPHLSAMDTPFAGDDYTPSTSVSSVRRKSSRLTTYDLEDLDVPGSPELAAIPPPSPGKDSEGDSPSGLICVIRAAFLRVFVSLLQTYDDFLIQPENPDGIDVDFFDVQAFMAAQDGRQREFLAELTRTQAFNGFIEDRAVPKSSGIDFDALFFDETIDQKVNRSRWMRSKKATPFLDDGSFKLSRTLTSPSCLVKGAPELTVEFTDDLDPEILPPLNYDLFMPTNNMREPLCATVVKELNEYTRRIEEDEAFFKERMDEQREAYAIDWDLFSQYDANLPTRAANHYRSELEDDDNEDLLLHWIEAPHLESESMYYVNMMTFETRYNPPDFFLSASEYKNYEERQHDLLLRHAVQQSELVARHADEISSLSEQYEAMRLSILDRIATQGELMLNAQEKAQDEEFAEELRRRYEALVATHKRRREIDLARKE